MKDLGKLLASVTGSDDVAYVLGPNLAIVRTNAAWAKFAKENGGDEMLAEWPRGARITDAIAEPLRPFYAKAFARALATGERWEHDYECSTPETFRTFRMTIYPMNSQFLVVVNSCVASAPHDRDAHAADEGVYAVDEVITMCSHCRRVWNPQGAERWDWVPDFVRTPPSNLSHGLCPPCAVFYYGESDEDAAP